MNTKNFEFIKVNKNKNKKLLIKSTLFYSSKGNIKFKYLQLK